MHAAICAMMEMTMAEFDAYMPDNPELVSGMRNLGHRRPTEIQELVFADIRDGGDVLIQAPTGTGKTLAYLCPLFARYREAMGENKVIVLTPTHELAIQVAKQVRALAEKSGLRYHASVIVGDVQIGRQVEALKGKPEFIVGTAGRILELIEKRKIAANLVRTVVLDEGDRLFDEHHRESTHAVIKKCLRDRQLVVASASISAKAKEELAQWTDHAKLVAAAGGQGLPANIKHWYVVVPEEREKIEMLRGTTGAIRTKRAMIFINRNYDIEQAAEKLRHHHYTVDSLYGKRTKEERRDAMQAFRSGKVKYLIASDMAARGLQIDDVDTVFHLSIPEDPADYLHRAGRCGRAGRVGRNLAIVTEREVRKLHAYEKALGIHFSRKYYEGGKLLDKPVKTEKQSET